MKSEHKWDSSELKLDIIKDLRLSLLGAAGSM